MSEELNTVTDADDVFAATVPADEPKKPGRPGRGRKLLTVVLPAVLVLGAIGGGVTYTGVTVRSADRTAPTVVWEQPDLSKAPKDPALDIARGKASTPLSKMLLPVPATYELGPDIEGYGNDGELSGKEAALLLKEDGKGLSGKKRREYEKDIDRLGVQGIAFRSYAWPDEGLVVTVHITRMKDKKAIRSMFELRKKLSSDLLKFPKGPKIGGHKNSACFMYPQDKELDKEQQAEELDGMVCSAYDSEVLVTVTAAGAKPFDKSAVAELVKKQLEHIESPGEYV
ncbi:hypothetical protein [Streptomyces sp. NBC_01353]|uniref:hypothetical protein n=1 Tax=Streptomyces sp. NBC_01353 TaxID=2903835 RepID=UPI002E355716|nr:hypothetical protein [Streptomyces sp. NBC_01353]